MSCEQNSGKYYNLKMGNKFFESVEKFKYLETTVIIQIALMKKLRAD